MKKTSTRMCVIIACRGELPENIEMTVRSLRADMNDRDKILIVNDGPGNVEVAGVETIQADSTPRGPGFCRDAGYQNTDAEYIAFVDGHMQFPKGWIKRSVLHLSRLKTDILCPHMQSMNHDRETKNMGFYAGAQIKTFCSETTGEHVPIGAKWNDKDIKKGPIGACMGACYVMRREFYGKMGRPLSILRAWGGDEELLSICAWMAGGRVYLTGWTVNHMYAAPHTRKPTTKAELCAVWSNRAAIVNALPMSEDLQTRLIEHVKKTAFVRENKVQINRMLDARSADIELLKEKLGAFNVQFDDFPSCVQSKPDAHVTRVAKDQKSRQTEIKQKPKPKKTTPNYHVNDDGFSCPHCKERCYIGGSGENVVAVTNTYPNGNRRVFCAHCERPFIAVRKI